MCDYYPMQSESLVVGMYVDKTWSVPFDTWQVCVFLAHIGRVAVAASPICCQKTQTSHVSKGNDHVLYLSYLKNAYLGQNVMLFH